MEIQDILNDTLIQNYINRNEFPSLYERINELLDKYDIIDDKASDMIGKITQLLIKSGVDPLKTLTVLPWSFLWDAKDIHNIKLEENGVLKFSEFGWQFAGSGLRNLVIPRWIKYIPEGFCCECLELKEIIIPNAVISIAGDAFSYCENLEKIIFTGTMHQWEKGVNKASGWVDNKMHFKIICQDGIIEI